MNDDQIKYMVNRFLGWHLPERFQPDAGISFAPYRNVDTDHPIRNEPTGTNLFDARQAEEMVRHLVEGLPANDASEADLNVEINQLIASRDRAEAMADKLAEKIAAEKSLNIGEHSSGNCPWQNALDGVSEESP